MGKNIKTKNIGSSSEQDLEKVTTKNPKKIIAVQKELRDRKYPNGIQDSVPSETLSIDQRLDGEELYNAAKDPDLSQFNPPINSNERSKMPHRGESGEIKPPKRKIKNIIKSKFLNR
ncbi:hypothetical protein [Aquimarina sp. RZ0]|uniref:hypothetical protein n=1 Tax=Aquimarina sp. RZ0 TaxID=2607730 RepID=UPI0011F17C55|nr:hypothetical protein [Aquimarina sp. RZ0]KAA1243060.1 hypothetical protein F0000_22880 [Aquimarina sp. RZ0]